MTITSVLAGARLFAQTSTAPSTASVAQPALSTTALPGRQSWVSDRRDFHLGDIVTILVDEYTLTSLDKRVDVTDNRQRQAGISTNTATSSSGFGLGTSNNASSSNRGTDARVNQITTQMSARVVEISPNGLMRLQGTKTINVEKTKINLTLSGWARTRDVSPDNAIQSYRLADANLDYQAEGPLGTPKGGILSRLMGKFWP